jgi:Type II CAAX prenyl endopeptidase Rce1-like
MQINWPLIIVLFCLSLPGVFITIPRIIQLLLPENSKELKQRITRIAIGQTLAMILLMSYAGTILSMRTGLNDPLLESLLQGQAGVETVQGMVLPVLACTIGGLIVFLVLYYGLVSSILDGHSLQIMRKIRAAIGLDGCILYGGVVEEILARWGLMNLIAFFAILFAGKKNPTIIWSTIIISGILYALGQLPIYLAAGCQPGRRLIYTIILLTVWQAIVFGWIFWQYGLLAAIIAHMLFHLGWGLYDQA